MDQTETPSGGTGDSTIRSFDAQDAAAPSTTETNHVAHKINEVADSVGSVQHVPPVPATRPSGSKQPSEGDGWFSSLKPPGRQVKEDYLNTNGKQGGGGRGSVTSSQGPKSLDVPWKKLSTENKAARLSERELDEAIAKQMAREERTTAARIQEEEEEDARKPAAAATGVAAAGAATAAQGGAKKDQDSLKKEKQKASRFAGVIRRRNRKTVEEEKAEEVENGADQSSLKAEKQKASRFAATRRKNRKQGDEEKEQEWGDDDIMSVPVSSSAFVAANSDPSVEHDSILRPGAIAVRGIGASQASDQDSFISFDKEQSSSDMPRRSTKEGHSTNEVLLNAVLVEDETQRNVQSPDIPYVEATAVEDDEPRRKRLFIFGLLALVVVGIVVGVTVPLTAGGSPSGTSVGGVSPTVSPSPSSSPTEFPTMAPTSSVTITIAIQLDNNPEETGWRLDCGPQTIAAVPFLTYEDRGRQIVVQSTVGLGADCELTLEDSGGDGIEPEPGGDGIESGYAAVYFGEGIADEALLVRESGEFNTTKVIPFQVIMPPTEAPTLSPAPTVSANPTGTSVTIPITIFLMLDQYPTETGWNLTCDSTVIASVTSGFYAIQNEMITETVEVDQGALCLFIITDTVGDGLCCGFGDGSYSLFLGEDASGELVGEGGEFVFEDQVSFNATLSEPTISPAPSSPPEPTISPAPTGAVVPITIVLQLDQYPTETGWGLACDGAFREVFPGTYSVAFNLVLETFDVGVGAECLFYIFDTAGDGICCSFGAGSYNIFLGEDATGLLLAGGGDFGSLEEVIFIAAPPEPSISPAPTPTLSPISTASLFPSSATSDPLCTSICPDGSQIDPVFNDAVVFVENGVNTTCDALQRSANLLGSNDENFCGKLFYVGVKYCGCVTTFDFCDLCEDGGVPPDLLLFPTPNISCADYAGRSFAESTTSSDGVCATAQATYGEYCGCSNPIASQGACHLCGEEPVPDAGRIISTPEIDGIFCADLEYQANLPGVSDTQCVIFQATGASCCPTVSLSLAPSPAGTLAATPSASLAVPSATPECISSLDTIFFAEQAVVDDIALRIYNLCPNTTYEVDTEFDDNNVPVNGKQRPLIFGRSNVIVLCGLDGRSENGCVLSGGLYQAAFEPSVFGTTGPLENVQVQGLTFSRRDISFQIPNVFTLITGEIVIRDCVFSENSVDWALIVQDPGFGTRRREHVTGSITEAPLPILDPSSGFPARNQRLQSSQNASSVLVTMEGCRFQDNVAGTLDTRPSGMIENNAGTLIIRDTIFENGINGATPPSNTRVAYTILNQLGLLELTGNCFIENDVTVAPVINQLAGVVQVAESNFVVLSIPAAVCDFIANVGGSSFLGDQVTPIADIPFSCVDHDLDTCGF